MPLSSLAFIVLAAVPTLGQEPSNGSIPADIADPYTSDVWRTDHGLPQNTVLSIF